MSNLQTKSAAVLGYGSQGHAHAQNLRDSGWDVVIGLYEGSQSAKQAALDGFRVHTVEEAVKQAAYVVVLLPDERQPKVFEQAIAPSLRQGQCLVFAHGFGVHYGYVKAPENVDVVLVAPKGPGHLVRRVFQSGMGVPGLIAVHQDATGQAWERADLYAEGIGSKRAGILKTTFKEETETDLFGEQSVLCGGLTQLMQAGFETLVEAGYQKEIAYFECVHEMKLIVDLLYEGGFEKMRHSISNTAEYGDYVAGPKIINQAVRDNMKLVLSDIQSGRFATQWMMEVTKGMPWLQAQRDQSDQSELAQTGSRLRALMQWGEADDKQAIG